MSTVVIYAPNGHGILLEALKQHSDRRNTYYICVPPPSHDRTLLREPRAYLSWLDPNFPNIKPLAEFNRGGWNKKPGHWRERAEQFRAMLDATGLNGWYVNEASSGIRDPFPQARRDLEQIVTGLALGSGGQPQKGFVFQQGPGYKQGLEHMLKDRRFWTEMDRMTEAYGFECYASPGRFGLLNHARRVAYLFGAKRSAHFQWLPLPHHHQLKHLYMPVVSCYWYAHKGYGDSEVPLAQMQSFVRSQLHLIKHSPYKAIAWNEHPGDQPPTATAQLAKTVAQLL